MKIRRGRADKPKPFSNGDMVVKLIDCPDCDGRGYFLINPFLDYGLGSLDNMTQCLTCLDSKVYYDKFKRLPPEIVVEMENRDGQREVVG
jgi:hypothetical protein